MDDATIDRLNQLTHELYAQCSDSFSATRKAPWTGWERVCTAITPVLNSPQCKILDLGCGNLRFEEYLATRSSSDMRIWAIDSCPALVPLRENVRFLNLDIISRLHDQTLKNCMNEVPECDLVCAFGLFHHVPGHELRKRLLDLMYDKTAAEGFIVMSLWDIERDERLLGKARRATHCALERHPQLQLDDHDWLLGWQDRDDVLRYCHSFTETEADMFIEHLHGRVELVDRFRADGKSGDLNEYLVFQKLH